MRVPDLSMQLWSQLKTAFPQECFLYVPPLLGVASLGYVSFRYLASLLPPNSKSLANGKSAASPQYVSDLLGEDDESVKESGNGRDPLAMIAFRLVRLLAILALLSLQIYELTGNWNSKVAWSHVAFFIYASALASLAVVAPSEWRQTANRQLAIITFFAFLTFFYLDAWPYATYKQSPYHDIKNPITWIRLGLLAFVGVFVSLFSPRPAIHAGRTDEDTVSLFSRATYGYLSSVVFHAWQVPSITIDEMPELPLKETSTSLRKKTFPELDPVLLGRKRHLFWGMLRAYKREYFEIFLWVMAEYLLEFAAPLGMKNMLAYIESGVSPMGIKPWVWIAVLGVGPVLSACASTQFLYLGTRFAVESESVFTQLVFEHSLRIRLKSDALDKKDDKKDGKKKRDKKGGKDTKGKSPSTATPASGDAQTQSSAETETDTLVDSEEATPEGGHAKAKTGHLVGKINNLVTTDAQTIQFSYQVITLCGSALQAVLSVYFLYELLGWSAFVGLGAILIAIPVPAYLGQLIVKAQKDKMARTDKRVQSVTETLGVLRMIKLFAWEKHSLKEIGQRRDEELKQVKRGRILSIIMNCSNTLMPLFAKLTTITVYALVVKGDLSASRMFSALMVFGMMENQVWFIMYQVPEFLKAKVAWDRYDEFINGTEMLESVQEKYTPTENVAVPPDFDRSAIGFNACTFSWDSFDTVPPDSPGPKHGREQFFLRFDSELTFKRGCINIIVGPTGSGKTSILMALLGEMYYKPDGIGSWCNLPRESGIAYAAQESWVLNETIKDNVLMGQPYDEQRYKKVLKQCALERDLGLWEAGDLTEVGEKGLTLSGGQKARITLARALYSDASILLLDDILAALDVHTAKWVVDKALLGDLIRDRTVILVTHNIALAAPVAEHVVNLGKNGTVAAQGSVADVLKTDSRLRKQAEDASKITDVEADLQDKEKDKEADKDVDKTKKAAGKLVVAEEKALGRVKWSALKLFVEGVGSVWIWVAIFMVFWSSMFVNIYQRWVMAWWTTQYDTHAPSEVPVIFFLSIYSAGSIMELVLDVIGNLYWMFRTLRASRIIHANLMESVFTSTFRWLDVTPVGRIVTRSTQDINAIDGPFMNMLKPLISITINLIALFVSSVVMAGWSAFIPGVILMVVGGFLGRVYLIAQIGIRREMSNAKAPVMSQISTVLGGIISIRAYSAHELFRKGMKKRADALVRASLTFYDINRWVSVRIDSLGGLFAAAVTVYFVYFSGVPAGYVGFTLSMVFTFSSYVLYWVRFYNLVEVQANSLERVLDFMNMDHEPKPTQRGVPPAYWPSSGAIRVENLSAQYSDDSPEILHDISFEIKSGERVGVVGRTGAGKSSVTLALLRAIKTTGQVYYDGLPTSEINLDVLRSNITLIPQQPELMHGTLRENLDPFGEHDDATLNGALQTAGLYDAPTKDDETVQNLNGESKAGSSSDAASIASSATPAKEAKKKIGLDTTVESGGTNFSLGQRQIIALARAIVRGSKLLILDEATAAIDYETDAVIQKTLRTEFGKDTTFITIAHRLQTIMDSDKIMVLDAGRIAEFDSPKNLLMKKDGLLKSLVQESEDQDILMRAAGVDVP